MSAMRELFGVDDMDMFVNSDKFLHTVGPTLQPADSLSANDAERSRSPRP